MIFSRWNQVKCETYNQYTGYEGHSHTVKTKGLRSRLTHGAGLVESGRLLVGGGARDVVSKADGGDRDETEVEGVEEGPLGFQAAEDGRWHKEDERDEQRHDT